MSARNSIFPVLALFALLIIGAPSTVHAQSGLTNLQVCHSGGPRLYVAVYQTYQGWFSGFSVEGWWRLENGRCLRETLSGRDVRAYAFAMINSEGKFVALPFEFNTGRSRFDRSTKAICVPVQETLEEFKFASQQQYGVTPPCSSGQVPLETSFSVLGGTVDQTIRLNVSAPNYTVAPDVAYAQAWQDLYGESEPNAEVTPKKEESAANKLFREVVEAQKAKRLKEEEKKREAEKQKEAPSRVPHMPYRSL